MILPSHTSSYAWQSRCNYSQGGGDKKRDKTSERVNSWKGRRIKQMSVESAFCSVKHPPLCLLTLVSKQLRRLNSRPLTYGCQLRCSSLDTLSCLLGRKQDWCLFLPLNTGFVADTESCFVSSTLLFIWPTEARLLWLQTDTMLSFHGYSFVRAVPHLGVLHYIREVDFFSSFF